MVKTYKGLITELPENGIFVFGANTQGRHGKGAAKTARDKFGAEYGNPRGMQGRAFAITTKDLTKYIHPSVNSTWIETQIRDLYAIATHKPHLDFYVAYSGSGTNLNGYSNEEMAKMFAHVAIPPNIIFEEAFCELMKGFIKNELHEKSTK